MEALNQDYADKGVQFYYIYKYLAHAGKKGYVQPYTLDERLMHMREAKKKLGTKIPWLCDTMDNQLKHRFGDAPTSEFVLDPQGIIVRRRAWGNANLLRQDLVELVGPVDNPTKPEDLNLPKLVSPDLAPTGIVERIERPKRMKPLHVEPLIESGGQPFYAKLRPQADEQLLRTGSGKLYLEFLPDLLYDIHWNNLAEPIEVEFNVTGSMKLEPSALTGPEVEEPSDIDAREFLVDVKNWNRGEPLELTVRYFACNDKEGWCKPITQRYTISRTEDVEDGYYINDILNLNQWSQFRGPRGDGKSTATDVPTQWSSTENVKWRTPLPGPGGSSPIISGDRVFITCAKDSGRLRTLYCLDRSDGHELWSRTVEYDEVMPTHKTNPYCASTPLAVGERVVVWHGSAGLYCYDLDGNELWAKDLGEFRHIWGYASSPVFFQGKIILNCGPGERSFMTAIDLATGKTRWKTDEPGGESGDALAGEKRGKKVGSWSTPVIARVDGSDQIICSMPTRVNAYDPATGEILWYCTGLENQPRGDLAYTSPVIAGDLAIAMAGYTGPAIGLRLGGSGDVTESNRLWRSDGPNPQRIGSGVIVGDHLYMANAGAGVIQCLVAATGQETWRARIAGGNAWGSIVMAEGKLYVTAQNGDTVVFSPNPKEYEEIAVNALGEPSNSTPALADGQIFIRTSKALYRIDKERLRDEKAISRLLFREDWKETPAELPITQDHVASDDLKLTLHGPGKQWLKKSHHVEPADDPFYLWSGQCKQRWAFSLQPMKLRVDLSAPDAKFRLRTKQGGGHVLYAVIKTADERWYISQEGVPTTDDWQQSELSVADLSWSRFDIREITRGRTEIPQALNSIEKIGFTDLHVGDGSKACSRVDWIELWGDGDGAH